MELKSLIIQEAYKANTDFLLQQNIEYKNLCELVDKLGEVLDLIGEQTFSLESEGKIAKDLVKYEETIDTIHTKLGGIVTKKYISVAEQIQKTKLALAAMAIKELKK